MKKIVSLCLFTLVSSFAGAQKFYPDDPIQQDRDRLPIDAPGVIELSPTYDLLENTFAPPAREDPIPRAANTNTLGEVPNSSWFTNRIGARAIGVEALARGPATGGPPNALRPLIITAAKQGGITPGFTVRDVNGHTYFIKFDPKPHLNLSTGADVIAKNFFHAIGYNVPEAYIVYVRVENFVIDPAAVVNLPGGRKAPMDREYLDFMLEGAARNPDGNIRTVASLMVPGEILGPLRFYGTRSDDPNDIFPHQHRRELRGYRVFCAWLNHDDSRSINTLDTFVKDQIEGGFVRHYLIDFGSTLGSGSDHLRRISPQDPRAGNEYMIDLENAWKSAYTFGLVDRPWRRVKYPYPAYAEIGRIEADFFEPQKWKPEYPNVAFDHMLPDDAFWAAKIVARFSDEAIRAIVAAGECLSRDAAHYLADTIITRRDKVVAHYYRQLSPLDAFEIEGAELVFRNLGEEWDLTTVETYDCEWFTFENESSQTTSLGAPSRVARTRISVPDSEAEFLMVRIRTKGDEPNWHKAVEVYLRKRPSGRSVVGIDREI